MTRFNKICIGIALFTLLILLCINNISMPGQLYPEEILKDLSLARYYNKINSIHSPPSNKLLRNTQLMNFSQFFDYVEHPTVNCTNEKSFGGVYSVSKEHYFDGDKIVCMDEVFKMNRKSCKVYSFGISNEWSFDDAIAKYGCTVYAFDPTMSRKYYSETPKIAYKRGDRIFFLPIGLGGKDERKWIGKRQCELRRMSTLLEYLGHNTSDIIIDYLKIDIEGSEVEFLQDILYNTPEILNKFKQIGMEIHPTRANSKKWKLFEKYYKYFIELENRGFKLFNSRMNPISSTKYKSKKVGKAVNEFYEMVWAKF